MANNIENSFVFIPQKVWEKFPENPTDMEAQKIKHLPRDTKCGIYPSKPLTQIAAHKLIVGIKDASNKTHYHVAMKVVGDLQDSFKSPNTGEDITSIRFYKSVGTEEGVTIYVEVGKCKDAKGLEAQFQASSRKKIEASKLKAYSVFAKNEHIKKSSAKRRHSESSDATEPEAVPSRTLVAPAEKAKKADASIANSTKAEGHGPDVETIFAAFEAWYPFSAEEIFMYCHRFPALVEHVFNYYPKLKSNLLSVLPEELLEKHQSTTIQFISKGVNLNGQTLKKHAIVDFVLSMAENIDECLDAMRVNPTCPRELFSAPKDEHRDKRQRTGKEEVLNAPKATLERKVPILDTVTVPREEPKASASKEASIQKPRIVKVESFEDFKRLLENEKDIQIELDFSPTSKLRYEIIENGELLLQMSRLGGDKIVSLNLYDLCTETCADDITEPSCLGEMANLEGLHFPNMRILSAWNCRLSPADFRNLCGSCSKLEELSVSGSYELDTLSGCVFPELKKFNASCSGLATQGFAEISNAMPKLTSLDVRGCKTIDWFDLDKFENLVHFFAAHTYIANHEIALLGTHNKKLETLDLSNCPRVDTIDASLFTSLRELKIKDVSLKAGVLSKLKQEIKYLKVVS